MANIKKAFDKIHIKELDCARGKRYFDPVRKIFTPITPEEVVRQRAIVYLQGELGVPLSAMHTEEHLAHHGVKDSRGRMDISLGYRDSNEQEHIIAVVECKETNVPVEDVQQVIEQALRYVTRVNAKYFVLVNGIDMVFYYMESAEHYRKLDGILTYDEMLRDVHVFAKEPMPFHRLSYKNYDRIWRMKLFHAGWYKRTIGEDTPKSSIPCIVNLYDCLMDTNVQLLSLSSERFELVEDFGTQFRKYGDASGSDFGTGYYRVMLVSDKEKDYKFLIGFGIMATGKVKDDPRYGNSGGKSVLLIIYNDGDSDTTIAQINLNKYLSIDKVAKIATLFHNGAMGTRKKGLNQTGLFAYISERSDSMIQGRSVNLGTVDYSVPLTMQDDDVANLVTNIVEYAVYRNEYIHGSK